MNEEDKKKSCNLIINVQCLFFTFFNILVLFFYFFVEVSALVSLSHVELSFYLCFSLCYLNLSVYIFHCLFGPMVQLCIALYSTRASQVESTRNIRSITILLTLKQIHKYLYLCKLPLESEQITAMDTFDGV